MKAIPLEQSIEANLKIAWNAPTPYARKQGREMVMYFAKQYLEEHGVPYVRGAVRQGNKMRGVE